MDENVFGCLLLNTNAPMDQTGCLRRKIAGVGAGARTNEKESKKRKESARQNLETTSMQTPTRIDRFGVTSIQCFLKFHVFDPIGVRNGSTGWD